MPVAKSETNGVAYSNPLGELQTALGPSVLEHLSVICKHLDGFLYTVRYIIDMYYKQCWPYDASL